MTRILPGAPYRRRRLLAGGITALALMLAPTALLRPSGGTPAPPPAASPTLPCAEQVAQDLSLAWTPEEGVTEELDAFHAGMLLCERARGEWVCWIEENLYSPTGVEKICGVPEQLNDFLAREGKIWSIDFHPIFPDPSCRQAICGKGGNEMGDNSISSIPSSPPSPSPSRRLAL